MEKTSAALLVVGVRRIADLPPLSCRCYFLWTMSALTEIEQAADSLSADELRALLGHVEARLLLAEAGARSNAAEQLMRTLHELGRPMGGKPWNNRDILHER